MEASASRMLASVEIGLGLFLLNDLEVFHRRVGEGVARTLHQGGIARRCQLARAVGGSNRCCGNTVRVHEGGHYSEDHASSELLSAR